MSSFETQAAGLARPRSSPGPHFSIPLTRAPKAPLRSPPCSLHPVAPRRRTDPLLLPHHHPGDRFYESPVPAGSWVSPWPRCRPAPTPLASGEGAPAGRGFGGRRLPARGRARLRAVRVREGELVSARARECVCVSLSVSRLGSSALAGPPVASFPVLSPGPHRVETGHLVKRCFWPSGRRGDGRRKAPSPEFFSIKSDKKFREK